MRLWISGEVEEDVAEPYRAASVDVKNSINELISANHYGDAILDWDLIGIVVACDTQAFPEVKKYKKSKKSIEFRLQINHSAFLAATAQDQRSFVMSLLLRSIRLSKSIVKADFDHEAFESGVLGVAKLKGWDATTT